MGTLAVETKPLHGIESVSRLFMSSQLLLLYHSYVSVLKHGSYVETVCSVLKYIRDLFIFY